MGAENRKGDPYEKRRFWGLAPPPWGFASDGPVGRWMEPCKVGLICAGLIKPPV